MAEWTNPSSWPSWLTHIDLVLVVHIAIALSLLEFGGRFIYATMQGRTAACLGTLLHLGAGLCLMFALREALLDTRAASVLGWLSASGAAHLGDIVWHRRQAARAKAQR